MSVKLYNSSGLADEPIRQLLLEAKLLAGAKGGVVVKVTRPVRREPSEAKRAGWVRESWLKSKRNWREHTGRRIRTAGGYVIMRPHMFRHPGYDCLKLAEEFFQTAVHEFAHIVQFQTGRFHDGEAARFAYKMEWKRRPHELDAINRTDAALERLGKQAQRKARIDELVIELAIQMEAAR